MKHEKNYIIDENAMKEKRVKGKREREKYSDRLPALSLKVGGGTSLEEIYLGSFWNGLGIIYFLRYFAIAFRTLLSGSGSCFESNSINIFDSMAQVYILYFQIFYIELEAWNFMKFLSNSKKNRKLSR